MKQSPIGFLQYHHQPIGFTALHTRGQCNHTRLTPLSCLLQSQGSNLTETGGGGGGVPSSWKYQVIAMYCFGAERRDAQEQGKCECIFLIKTCWIQNYQKHSGCHDCRGALWLGLFILSLWHNPQCLSDCQYSWRHLSYRYYERNWFGGTVREHSGFHYSGMVCMWGQGLCRKKNLP